jgi:hypothetical protein
MARIVFRAAALAAVLLVGADTARAGYALVTSRAALGGTDSIDWAQLGPELTVVPSPAAVMSAGGVSATVSQPVSPFERRDEGTTWFGNFAPGDALLYTSNVTVGGSGPMTIDFGSTSVVAAGAQIQAVFYGTFTGRVEALDGMGMVLASFDVPGLSDGAADNSAIFLGIVATGGDSFAQVRFDTFDSFDTSDFAINRLDLTVGGAAAVPAPAGLVLLAAAAPVFGLRRLARRKVA